MEIKHTHPRSDQRLMRDIKADRIGTRLVASVICTSDNVCPRYLPSEFGLDIVVDT